MDDGRAHQPPWHIQQGQARDKIGGRKFQTGWGTDIPNLPYLQAVVKESLRLYPPSPVVIRKRSQNCKIKGFDIPQGVMLAINVYAIMRDPEIWDSPNEFRPKRFLASSNQVHDSVEYNDQGPQTNEQNFNYAPFGGGAEAVPWLRSGAYLGEHCNCNHGFNALIGRLGEKEMVMRLIRLIWRLEQA